MLADVAQSRIVRATSATLTFTGRDQYGEPGNPGTVTVQVVDSQGNDIKAAGTETATPTGATNERTVTLTPAETAALDQLTATWTSDDVVLEETIHDVVGGVYCALSELRGDGSAVKQRADHPDVELIEDRTEVEYQFESVCNRAFVPRFAVDVIDRRHRSSDELILYWPDLRRVVWAQYWTGSAWAAVTVDVTSCEPNGSGIAVLASGCWPTSRLRVGYEYGWDRPPPDMRRAAIKATRSRRHADRAGIDDRAVSINIPDVGTMQLATPGRSIWVTAIPEVDEVLNRYKFHRFGKA
ncbi:MAG: hypothetical protein AAGA42_14385 [Actinomycetota bacterium]